MTKPRQDSKHPWEKEPAEAEAEAKDINAGNTNKMCVGKNIFLVQESQVGHILAEDHRGYFRNGESNPGLQGENLLS
jgi:hypothetical protein